MGCIGLLSTFSTERLGWSISFFRFGCFHKIGVPPPKKWMENPIKKDDLGGKPTIFGHIHLMFWGSSLPMISLLAQEAHVLQNQRKGPDPKSASGNI